MIGRLQPGGQAVVAGGKTDGDRAVIQKSPDGSRLGHAQGMCRQTIVILSAVDCYGFSRLFQDCQKHLIKTANNLGQSAEILLHKARNYVTDSALSPSSARRPCKIRKTYHLDDYKNKISLRPGGLISYPRPAHHNHVQDKSNYDPVFIRKINSNAFSLKLSSPAPDFMQTSGNVRLSQPVRQISCISWQFGQRWRSSAMATGFLPTWAGSCAIF